MCCIVLFQNKTGENFFMISVTDKFRKSILILFQCDSVYLVNYDLEKFFHGSVDECYKPQLVVIPAIRVFCRRTETWSETERAVATIWRKLQHPAVTVLPAYLNAKSNTIELKRKQSLDWRQLCSAVEQNGTRNFFCEFDYRTYSTELFDFDGNRTN